MSHAYDSGTERDLTVVIGRVLCHIAAQLGYLDLSFKLSLEAGKDDFTLAWFEAITERWDGTSAVCDRVLN